MEVLQGPTVVSWFSETHGDLHRMIRSVMGLLLFPCKGRKEEHGQRKGLHPSLPVKEGGRHGGRGRSWVGWLDLPGTEGDWPGPEDAVYLTMMYI